MRLFPALALGGALLLGACQNPDGSLNVPATAALAGGAALAGAAIASSANQPRYYDNRAYYYGRPSYGYNYGYYGRPRYYRGW
jgi:hypothetical protein